MHSGGHESGCCRAACKILIYTKIWLVVAAERSRLKRRPLVCSKSHPISISTLLLQHNRHYKYSGGSKTIKDFCRHYIKEKVFFFFKAIITPASSCVYIFFNENYGNLTERLDPLKRLRIKMFKYKCFYLIHVSWRENNPQWFHDE